MGLTKFQKIMLIMILVLSGSLLGISLDQLINPTMPTIKHDCNSTTLAAQMRLMGRGEGYNVGYMVAQEDCSATIRDMHKHDKPVDHANLGGPGSPAR